jgi:Domain of unknown function (DUF6134)
MRMAALIAGLLLSCAVAGAQPPAPGAQPPAPGARPPAAPPPLAAAQPAIETLEFAIMRKGEQIGTHRIELRRTGKETSVSVETNVEVKVLFVTAYRFQYTATERWVNGRLVALSAETDDNGTQHKLTAALKGATLEVDADGKAAQVDKNIIPASLWNPELVRQSVMLDTQTGQVMPISVVDGGSEEVTVETGPAPAHRYTIKGKFSQDVWYDSRGRLVQSQLVAKDGSVITYKLI